MERIETDDAPRALGPYSQGSVAGPGSQVFVSGQLGIDPGSGELKGETVQEQTAQCLNNIVAIIRGAGGDAASIVKTTIYLKRVEDFAGMNEVYSRFMKPPCPARSCVGGCDLPRGALVEIEAIAVVEGYRR